MFSPRSAYYSLVRSLAFFCRGRISSAIITGCMARLRLLADSIGPGGRAGVYLGHLRRVFPDRSEAWRKRTMLGYWRKHERGMLGLFLVGRLEPGELRNRVEWCGREVLDQAVAEGQGVLLLAPHFGDERAMHILLAMSGYPMHVISSAYDDAPPSVRRARLEVTRRWHHVAFPDQSPRWMFDALSAGELVQIAPTAYAGPRGLWVTSFGVPVLVTSTPYRVRASTGCAMVLAHNHALPGFRYRMEFDRVEPSRDMLQTAQRVFGMMEAHARRHPDQYDWMNLAIRHRETNTIARIGRIPSSEEELESLAVPSDEDPSNLAEPGRLSGTTR
ncbi:lysophospholipid acyltransferase family protein [Candidatus Fermentibacterales bacterium]|nr:lysophospholipid acyltransferase family protein [Candidatus Fermentibacterales bacterium]